ncbi:MAG TPA: tripartite tricarboxylate transporter substrate-binding protein [Xanthobacteraceae bacterium]
MTLHRRTVLSLLAGGAAGPRIAFADTFPSRPIHLVVGFTPGAASDIIGRLFAQGAAPLVGQEIVVENKPGAGSLIAAQYVAHAAKDGCTLFLPARRR